MNTKKHGYWIHHRKKTDMFLNGYVYISRCDCSQCGATVNMEKPVCPYCFSVMDAHAPRNLEGPIDDEE